MASTPLCSALVDSAALYLDLMKRVLTRTGFEEVADLRAQGWKRQVLAPTQRFLARRAYRLVANVTETPATREDGRDWPRSAETMIGRMRLDNIQQCVETVLADDVSGDLIEAGVWRGGASIFMRAVLAAHEVTDRTVWLADSFQGLPLSTHPVDVASGIKLDDIPQLEVSQEAVRRNFDRYGLLDDQVRFLPGWFKDTLPIAPLEELAVVRLDGDLYESTWDAITVLYPKLSPGGFLIVDDYGDIPACAKAIHDYRDEHGITEPIEEVDWTGAFWRKDR
jgi:O-methyltransferase